MQITHKHHSIITLILLGIILIGTLLTKVTTVTVVEMAGGQTSDTDDDFALSARDQLAVNRNHYDILMEERALFGVPSTSAELTKQATNLQNICSINTELKNICQTNCIGVDESTKINRGCYDHCLDESGNDISDKYECVNITPYDLGDIDYSDILEQNGSLEDQIDQLQTDLSRCEAEKSMLESMLNGDGSDNLIGNFSDMFSFSN